MISLIASVGKKREIGRQGDLAFTGRGELGYFRDTTLHHKILMGRTTFHSLPRRLADREYYVASFQPEDFPDYVTYVPDLEAFLKQHQNTPEEIFVIGGGSIYACALPYAQKLYLTVINAECPDADTFFPAFDPAQYEKNPVGKGAFDDGVTFTRFVYDRK